ncbi:DUF262 domain-containing protein [Glycomyces endophyticus]
MQNAQLSVQPMNLGTLYNLFHDNKLRVNRRYQRKLVWTVEEKTKLIDSVVNKLPIPLILLAQRNVDGVDSYELIDGLQRLDSFFSFMENQFAFNGSYFDLNTIGDTKNRLDAGEVQQLEPKMSRSSSLAISNYQIPVSIYREASTSSIDEVFRRINSGGRGLSLHEIRQAGATGSLADIVRKVSASIRGDGTFSESVLMKDMAKLSISRKELQYGLAIENVFWVRHDIIAPEDVRASGDEQLVLDLVLDAVIRPWPTSGWQNRDIAYGLPRKIQSASAETANIAVEKIGIDILHQRLTEIVRLIDEVMRGKSLGQHMVRLETYEKGTQRQFQAIFTALYELMFEQDMLPRSHEAVFDILNGFWNRKLSIPTGGSAWGKDTKAQLYPKVRKELRKAFYQQRPRRSAEALNSRLYIESLLNGSISEEPLVELKQGFCVFSDPPKENTKLFEEILQTAVAMANQGADSEGLILIGVCDKPSAAARARDLFGVESLEIFGHLILGTKEQIEFLGFDTDGWWRKWKDQILASTKISRPFANELASSFKPIVCDGRILWELRPKSLGKPITYDGRFFIRSGPSTHEFSADEFLEIVTPRFSKLVP